MIYQMSDRRLLKQKISKCGRFVQTMPPKHKVGTWKRGSTRPDSFSRNISRVRVRKKEKKEGVFAKKILEDIKKGEKKLFKTVASQS